MITLASYFLIIAQLQKISDLCSVILWDSRSSSQSTGSSILHSVPSTSLACINSLDIKSILLTLAPLLENTNIKSNIKYIKLEGEAMNEV